MASSNDSSLMSEEEYKGGDYFVDEIPEQLRDDCLVAYFRCRYEERDNCKYNDQDKNRIDRELHRIVNLKKTFEAEVRNKDHIEMFKYCQAAWRDRAIHNARANLDNLEDRLDKIIARLAAQKKSKTTPEQLTIEKKSRRLGFERKVLSAVEKWPRVTLPPRPAGLGPPDDDSGEKMGSFFSWFKKKPKKQPELTDQDPAQDLETKTNPKDFPIPEDSYGINITKVTLTRLHDTDSTFFKLREIDSTERYPLKQVLEDGPENPLRECDGTDTIRYFHFPANNMHWIEEAIARYYREKTPGEFNYRRSIEPPYCKKSSNLLCRRYWTSLQHGGVYDPVHARHLRPHCSLVTPDHASAADQIKGSKNFIMFMPYLHWETHQRRKTMAEIIKNITNKHHRDRSHVTESLREELEQCTEQIKMRHARQLSGLDETETADATKKENKKAPRSPLGEYLLKAAKIYDMMDIDPDVRLLREHLHKDPPLHARRTLDQSYYWKLPTTDGRDQDQVVYRATKTGKSILRTSRVVMVDQLWMYVLDDNTIITSFPRRWGRNKPDWSGVHKAIRSKLEHLRDGEIQSVYDLALLIMNQCSAVFFDRTKPVDERPEVLDIFSNALSHVSGMKTVAFETFWRQLNKLSASEHQQEDFETTARIYLNINPEGELLRETHDIIEELRMMMGIFSQQIHVMEEFSRHLENLHEKETLREPTNESTSPSELKVLMDIKKLLEEQQAAKLGACENGSSSQSGSTNPANMPNGNIHSKETPKKLVTRKTIPTHTLHLAEDVKRDMLHRKDELQKLEMSTGYVCDQLKALLDLKQQQASIIEAKYALKRADESVNQGRSIMLFTIITIIFLPLSFMSSVFGMNASEFSSPNGGNSMSLVHQFKLLFPISLGVIIISVALAFSTWIRSIISFIANIVWAVIFEYTYLRRLWKRATRNKKSDVLYRCQQNITESIYGRQDRKVMLQQWKVAKELEGKARQDSAHPAGNVMNGNASAHGALMGNSERWRAPSSGRTEVNLSPSQTAHTLAGTTPPQSRGGLSLFTRTPRASDNALLPI